MNSTVELLDSYSDLLIGIDMLKAEKAELADQILTPEQRQELSDLDAEFNPKIDALSARATKLQAQITAAVLERGETIKGTFHQAVWSKPRTSWDSKILDRIAEFTPELELARSVGKPSVSMRAVK